MSFFNWFKRHGRTYSQARTVVKQRDGTWTARVDVNGFPCKKSALMASGAMFDGVALLRNYGQPAAQVDDAPVADNPNVIMFPLKGGRK